MAKMAKMEDAKDATPNGATASGWTTEAPMGTDVTLLPQVCQFVASGAPAP